MTPSRRDLLKGVGALGAVGAVPPAIARALALAARRGTGTITDVEHVVILMQENRSFDHYFGTLRGVRGFGDPRALRLPSGASVFRQPGADGTGAVLPFHLDSRATAAPVVASLDHSWKGSHAEWARHDCWVRHKTPLTMGYFRREDVPFYHALADAFTIGDQYFCSLHGPTNPNRLFHFTGTSGLSIGAGGEQSVHNVDDGNWTGDMRRDKPGFAGWRWTTYAERLDAAGVSWKLYQEHDNYGDNPLAYFARFRGERAEPALIERARAIVPGSTAENAAATDAQHLVDAFARDVAADRLPQVSWIVAPFAYCEHPEASPQYGESLVARLLAALVARPDVWAKTALIINYDENDGFFDHVPAPIPATSPRWGASTVTTAGEAFGDEPVGLGVRVPVLAVSPWSRGGFVCSEVFDHTSVLRFLEKRFGVAEPNISPWRRAVTGDLTGMFDFAHASGDLPALPPTAGYRAAVAAAKARPAPMPPAEGMRAVQEPGQRPARPLPYALEVIETGVPTREGAALAFVNAGSVGAVFRVDAATGDGGPWYYTVEAGKRIDARVAAVDAAGRYDVTIHAPGGFVRRLVGAVGGPTLLVTARAGGDALALTIANAGTRPVAATLRPVAYGGERRGLALAPGARRTVRWPVAASDHWYDLAITADDGFVRRLAGHIETGRASRSDPAMGRDLMETATGELV